MSKQSKQPPLSLFNRTSSNPMKFEFHKDELGHTVVVGPVRAGKSTGISILTEQFISSNKAKR